MGASNSHYLANPPPPSSGGPMEAYSDMRADSGSDCDMHLHSNAYSTDSDTVALARVDSGAAGSINVNKALRVYKAAKGAQCIIIP